MSSFFEELKRRKVYRVAVGYLVAGWLIIQVAATIFPILGFPDWGERLIVWVVLTGFPLALALAWAFDVTPQGIQPTRSLPSSSGSSSRHRRRNIGLLVGFGVLISAVAGFFILPRAGAMKMEKSIAVLPFENFSLKPENAFFADGIQDDILTNLSKIGDLKVISRTSVMAYRGKQKGIREIGKELGVSAILEGSVRRDGDRVRINVQLINAENDHHIWAQEYDRELTDVFAIQTDLAQKIARELQAQLSPSEKAEITRKPTENNQAYLAFVEAHNLQASVEDIGKLRQAQKLYEHAIDLDPQFVVAMACLSMLHSWILHNFEPSDAEREYARSYAERALTLRPDSPEAHLARGYYLYYGERDYDGALAEFAVAKQGLPNDAHVYLVIGAIQRRQGKWKESTENLETAVKLNPNDTWPLQNLFFNYQMQRNFKEAQRVIDRAVAINPKSFTLFSLKATLAVQERGDLTIAEKGLAYLDEQKAKGKLKDLDPETKAGMVIAKTNVLFLRRDYSAALQTLRDLPPDVAGVPPHTIEGKILEGIIEEKLGRPEAARAAFSTAKETAEAAVKEAPNEAKRHAALARCLARLGEKEAAIAEAKRATELLPESVDAFDGPKMAQVLAEVYAVTGENAKAVAVLDGLLSRPSDVTTAFLKVDPGLDRLREDPGFQALIAKHERGA
jgi:TolB-like protein/Tfp pilus assembly protein PilF